MRVAFSRRRLLLDAGASVLAGAAASMEAAAPVSFRWILSTCLFGHAELPEMLPHVPGTGIQHLDVWPRGFGAQREQMEAMGHDAFAALLAKHRLKLGVTSRYDLGPLRLEEEMRIVGRLGGEAIVCGAQGPRGLQGGELKAAVREFAEKLRPFSETAEKNAIRVGIENHGGSLTASPDAIRWLADFAPPRFGIALAPYHLPQNPEEIARLIGDLAERMVFLYAWQRGSDPKTAALEQLPGRGAMDFAPIMRVLNKERYRGWVSIFMHSSPGGLPIRETPALVAEEVLRSRRYLEACLAKS